MDIEMDYGDRLGKVFPVSPDPTGLALGSPMILDAILGANTAFLAYKGLGWA